MNKKLGYIYPSDFKFNVYGEYHDDMYLKLKEKKHILLLDKKSLESEGTLFISETAAVGFTYILVGFSDISPSSFKIIEHFIRDHAHLEKV